jgi:hypothetical protein
MWILPKQLHTLDSVQDTEALNLDLNESSQLCAQSLFVRSKHSPLRTWLQKWKRDSWSQHLYGRILNPSLGKAFETEWASSLEATHANHSPQQGSEQERKTQDTCGLGSQTEFGFSDQECASSRMSKDISRWDSPASSATWKSWVTRCRGEYSLRVKSVRPTSASGCSSWPTSNARDWKDSINGTHPPSRPNLSEQTLGQAVSVAHGLPAPANPSTDGSRLGSWATPRANKVHPEITEDNRDHLANRNKSNLGEEIAGHCGKATGKLNPRWVETLMGLPIGWTMPSCTRPVTIAPMSFDCLGTESSQPPQNEHLEH